MKNIIIPLLCSLFLLGISCKKKPKAEENVQNGTEKVVGTSTGGETGNSQDLEKVKDCDDFINQYEEWSEEYVAFLSKHKDDPIKAVTSPEYSQMMLKASSWSQEWLSLSISCAQNSSYEKRVSEISDRMEEKIKELGFK